MKKTKQLSLFKPQIKFFGGALLVGRRKSIRPLSTKEAIHLVLRSEFAKGRDSFLCRRNRVAVDQIIDRFAKEFGVRIYQRAFAGNHIHLLFRITNRSLYRAFIRAISGKIASQVMRGLSFKQYLQSKPGEGCIQRQKGFWQHRPFSRIVSWGTDFKKNVQYLKQNVLEALGHVQYIPRKNRYMRWLSQIASGIQLADSS